MYLNTIGDYGMLVKPLNPARKGAPMTPAEAEPASPLADQDMACYRIAQAARLLDAVIAGRLAQYGVTPGQLPTLLALYDIDSRTQSDLARQIGVEQPTMAINLRRMERDGLIERRPDPGDGRKALVWLTKRARKIEAPIRTLRQEIDHDALDGIPHSRQRQLRRTLGQVVANLQDLKEEAAQPTRTSTTRRAPH